MSFRIDKNSLVQAIAVVILFGYYMNMLDDVRLEYLVLLSYTTFDIGIWMIVPLEDQHKFIEAYKLTQNRERAFIYVVLLSVLYNVIATLFVCLAHSLLSFWHAEHIVLWVTSFILIGWLGQTVQAPNKA